MRKLAVMEVEDGKAKMGGHAGGLLYRYISRPQASDVMNISAKAHRSLCCISLELPLYSVLWLSRSEWRGPVSSTFAIQDLFATRQV